MTVLFADGSEWLRSVLSRAKSPKALIADLSDLLDNAEAFCDECQRYVPQKEMMNLPGMEDDDMCSACFASVEDIAETIMGGA